MADPLSAIASVFALVSAGSQVAKGFKKLLSLKDAPDVVVALQNEVTDCCCVLEEIQSILEECAQDNFLRQASLVRYIERTRETILAVEHLIYYDLLFVDSESALVKIDKSRWLRAESKIQGLQMRMQSVRCDLGLGLQLLTASLSMEAFNQNRRMIVHSSNIGTTFSHIRTSLAQQSARIDAIPMQALQISESLPGHSPNLSDESEMTSEGAVIVPDSALTSPTSLDQMEAPYVFQITSAKHCSLDCICTCHQNNRTRSPQFLRSVLGSLFLGYQATPRFAQPCDDPLCRSGTIRLSYVYAFPGWFLNRILQASLSYSRVQGPELLLRLLRVRSNRDGPFQVFYGDYDEETKYEKVKGAIENAEASVLDVDQSNISLLHWAVADYNYKLIEYLLNKGADPRIENVQGMSAILLAGGKILCQPGSPAALMLSRFFDRSQLLSCGLSRLHQAYLGLSGTDFLSILESIGKTEIDEVDDISLTTLAWAAARGDLDAINRLLSCGADPNIPDGGKTTPLHLAATSFGGRDCIARLIEAKAFVNARDVCGLTPLMMAAFFNRSENVKALLSNGAEIDLIDLQGDSAIDFAVWRNSHKALETLLQEKRREGSQYKLHTADRLWYTVSADEQTLEILAKHAGNFKIDSDRPEEDDDESGKSESHSNQEYHCDNDEDDEVFSNAEEWYNAQEEQG